MATRLTFGCLAVFALSGCAVTYDWYIARPPSQYIKIEVVESVAQACPNVPESYACAKAGPVLCSIYLPDEVANIDAEVIKHEVRHCRGESHVRN